MLKIKRALISVSDRANLESLVKELDELGVEIISTGGTAKFISSLGIKVTLVEEVTGFPEVFEGRVKTLHPNIHGGLLFLRDKQKHIDEAVAHSILPIDMVVVSFYPFEKTISQSGVKLEEAVENIDVGGQSMVRSAAKNYRSVAVVTNPSQYGDVLKEMEQNNRGVSETMLASLATKAFKLTSDYDSAIYAYLKNNLFRN